MVKTLIEKIRKKVKSIDKKKVKAEISILESFMPTVAPGFNPHCVNIGSENYTAFDAKTINRALNQTGRGDFRYLARNGIIVGLAIHRGNGNGYRRVA
jgi:hypothetical protein